MIFSRIYIPVLLLMSQPLCAQHHEGARLFFQDLTDCAGSFGGWKCLELDLSSETTSLEGDSAKVYQYSWTLGDGSRKQGNTVEHCYEQYGSYQVSMDLIDNQTNTVIRSELSAIVDLYPEIKPAISQRRDNLPPSFVEFSFANPLPEAFHPDAVYWRIDGHYYEGVAIVHAFYAAGTHLVEMGIEKNTELTGKMIACASSEINITDSDIWTARMTHYVDSARQAMKSGPFVRTDIYCVINDRTENSRPVIIPLKFLMNRSPLKQGSEYEIMLFSGDLFTDKKPLNMQGLSGNELYAVLRDTISRFMLTPFHSLGSATFESGRLSDSMSESLRRTAELLKAHPDLKVEIGSYMHNGCRMTKGIKSSIAKSEFVRETLISHGIASDQLTIASPENNSALVNTCFAIPDCQSENEELNMKTEFKITGIRL